MRGRMLGVALVAIGGALSLGAATPSPSAGFLSQAELPDAVALLPPPPMPGSPADAADRKAFADSRALLGRPRWERAVSDTRILEPGALDSFSCAAGVTLSPSATPATWALLRRVVYDAGLGANPAKEHYLRPRPFKTQAGPLCVTAESLGNNTSYPSGHSAVGWTWGLILAELRPDRADLLFARGRDFGESRVVCGVHYPSDVEAGRLYGAAVVARLHADDAFRRELEAARRELARRPQVGEGCETISGATGAPAGGSAR